MDSISQPPSERLVAPDFFTHYKSANAPLKPSPKSSLRRKRYGLRSPFVPPAKMVPPATKPEQAYGKYLQVPDTVAPFSVTKKQAEAIANSPSLVKRWLYWTKRCAADQEPWLRIALAGSAGRRTLINYQSLIHACERAQRGDLPPRLPSDRKVVL